MLGSFAIAAQLMWILVIGLVSYTFGFGMNQAQRSSLLLGICSRNGGVMLVAFTALPAQDPNVLVMILLAGVMVLIVPLILARIYGSRAGKTVAGNAI